MRIWLFNYIALQRTYKNVRHLCGTQPSPSDPPVGPLGHYVFYSALTYACILCTPQIQQSIRATPDAHRAHHIYWKIFCAQEFRTLMSSALTHTHIVTRTVLLNRIAGPLMARRIVSQSMADKTYHTAFKYSRGGGRRRKKRVWRRDT